MNLQSIWRCMVLPRIDCGSMCIAVAEGVKVGLSVVHVMYLFQRGLPALSLCMLKVLLSLLYLARVSLHNSAHAAEVNAHGC
jgi:hypothetical protein